jgi:UDP-2-acetamido-3-amino-2,3-dideoxy-glucuronate N-acetyltransferase
MSASYLREYGEADGRLIPIELGRELPFVPKRMFMIHGVPEMHNRGNHAHRTCHQLFIAAAGQFTVDTVGFDRSLLFEWRESTLLSLPNQTLHVPPMTWATVRDISKDAVVMVFASEEYSTADYIHDYEQFKIEAGV